MSITVSKKALVKVACGKQKGFTSSQYKGVCKVRGAQRWEARLKHNNKSIYLGRFHREEDAARAYDTYMRKLYGTAARLNFDYSIPSTI